MPSVLITRPQAAAETLAEELQLHGYDGIIEPLLSIISTPDLMPDIGSFQATMITSANALKTLEADGYDIEKLLPLPCFCVGSKTAERATESGFQNVHSANGDGKDLAQLIRTTFPANAAILHIGGHDVDSKASEELQDIGFTIIPWSIYMAMPASKLSGHAVRLIKDNKVDAIVVFSVRTAETLYTLLKQHELLTCCVRLTAIGISDAVTKVLKPLPWKKTATASAPTEEAVIACLKQIFPVN